MAKMYKLNAAVLGLRCGDTFTSDDPFYEPFVTDGYISVIANDADSSAEDEDE